MVVFASPVSVVDEGVALSPHARYVLPISQAGKIESALKQRGMFPSENSNFNSYERRYCGQDLNASSILIYRHMAFGDQLILTGLTAYLRSRYPSAQIIYTCGAKVAEIWANNPDVELYAGAIPLETALKTRYHLLYESMLECNGLSEQGNAYDDMFAFGGMMEVPEEYKRPHIYLGSRDLALDDQWRSRLKGEPYIVYQWTSGNPVRQYPPDLAAKFLKSWTDTRIVVVGQSQDHIPEGSHIINLVNRTDSFRSLIPIVRQSVGVVCPDSSIGHLCAAFPEVKVLSLWGPFHPDDRVKYYGNHTPLLGRCPHGPCRTHSFLPPHTKCRDVGPEYFRERQCAALSTITPEMIGQEIHKWKQEPGSES